MIQMTPMQSRAAALALLVLAIVVVLALVFGPWWALKLRYDSALDDAVAHLQRYSRIAGMQDGLQKKALEVRALDTSKHFLKSASPALAAAELQDLAKTVIEANGGKISSIQILPHKDDAGYRQIAVSLQLAAPQSVFKGMLHAIESMQPYVFIDNLVVRSPMGNQIRVPEADLNIQFDLTGYALKGAP
jgi:general secretion pathway protein M